MILRFVSTLTLLAGLAAFGYFLHALGLLPTDDARLRHLRALKWRTDMPGAVTAITPESILALPQRGTLAQYAPLEQRGVVIEGYVQHILRAPDDDIHLEIVPRKIQPGEPGLPYLTGEITPPWRRGSRWTYDALLQAFRPSIGAVTPWDGGTRRVRLTGWLLYDLDRGRPGTEIGPPRISPWEVHPVTRIELWDDSLATWRELPR